MDGNVKDYGTLAGIAVAGLGGIALALRKLVKVWSADGRDLARIGGEMDVLEMLRTELGRVAEQNRSLSREIGELHLLVSNLRDENVRLKASVDLLSTQLASQKAQR